MDDQARDIFSLVAEVGFVLAGFSAVAISLRSSHDDGWPAATRMRAQGLLFSSLVPALLSLLVLGLSAGGTQASISYRITSALWVGATVPFTTFSIVRMRKLAKSRESSVTPDTWGLLLITTCFFVIALQIVNVVVLGLFWPLFSAFFYHLFAATDLFFRLMFRGPR